MALDGKIKVYKNYNDTVPLDIEVVKSILKPRTDTVMYGEKPGDPLTRATITRNAFDMVYEIRFIEDWTFAAEDANISKKPLAYALCYNETDAMGNLIRKRSFFWVKNK